MKITPTPKKQLNNEASYGANKIVNQSMSWAVEKLKYAENSLVHTKNTVSKHFPHQIEGTKKITAATSFPEKLMVNEKWLIPARTPSFKVTVRQEDQWVLENVSKKI